jgi:hypothetical protein
MKTKNAFPICLYALNAIVYTKKLSGTTTQLVQYKCVKNHADDKNTLEDVELSDATRDSVVKSFADWIIADKLSPSIFQNEGFKPFINLILELGAEHGKNISNMIPSPFEIANIIRDTKEQSDISLKNDIIIYASNGCAVTIFVSSDEKAIVELHFINTWTIFERGKYFYIEDTSLQKTLEKLEIKSSIMLCHHQQ